MGDDPPDPGGGGLQDVGLNITVEDFESSSAMDTEDGSVSRSNNSEKKRKRVRANRQKVCKHCNKKRRKHHSSTVSDKDKVNSCQCVDDILELENNNIDDKSPVTIPVENASSSQSQATPPSNSSQPSKPFLAVRKYISTDVAPYIVHIQKETSSPDDNSVLHPIEFGNFLKKNAFKNIINGSLKRIGRNRLSMSFSNFHDANNFVDLDCLAGKKLKAFIPSFNITRMGLVKGVPADWSEEEVKENISVPVGCGDILKVRRIKYKDNSKGFIEWNNSETVVLTFDGQVLPKRIFMCYNALPVVLYIYPTIQCFNCCRFGHTKLQCRSKPRCFRCGKDHTGDSCTSEVSFCCSCSGQHFATSKTCPEFVRQQNVKQTMAESCISYSEALKQHPRPQFAKSYAEVTSSQNKYVGSQAKPTTSPPKPPTNSPPPSTSYKKTVFLKPAPPPKFNKGYDRTSHEAIIEGYNTPFRSKGTALNNAAVEASDNQLSVSDIIIALINSLSKSNLIPSNVAPFIDLFTQLLNSNGQLRQNSPVELQEHYEQED